MRSYKQEFEEFIVWAKDVAKAFPSVQGESAAFRELETLESEVAKLPELTLAQEKACCTRMFEWLSLLRIGLSADRKPEWDRFLCVAQKWRAELGRDGWTC